MERRCFHCNRISESHEIFRSAVSSDLFALCCPKRRSGRDDGDDRDCVSAYIHSETNSLRLLEHNLTIRRNGIEAIITGNAGYQNPSAGAGCVVPPSVDNRTATEADVEYWERDRSKDGVLDGTLADPATFSADDLNTFRRRISDQIRTLDVLPFAGRRIEDEEQWTCGRLEVGVDAGANSEGKGPHLLLKCDDNGAALRCESDGTEAAMTPLTTLSSLVAAAKWAQCGKGFETVTDLSVRRTLRIPSSKIEARWPIVDDSSDGLAAILRTVSAKLCPYWTLRAELHDVLVYREGDMFCTHRDSRKGDHHVITLVVGVGGIVNDLGGDGALRGKETEKPKKNASTAVGGFVRFTPCTFFSDVHENGPDCSSADEGDGTDERCKSDDESSSSTSSRMGSQISQSNPHQWECKGEGSWCAWFIETEHEVTRVKSGYRCVAVYNVFIATEENGDAAVLCNEGATENASTAALPSTAENKRDMLMASSPSFSCFSALPIDVLRRVVDYLAMPTVKALRMTCRWIDRDVVGGIIGVAAGNLCNFKALPLQERRGHSSKTSSSPAADVYMNIPKEWLLKACAWGNRHSIGFVAGYNYSLDGKEKIVGTEEALLTLRGKDRLRALAICEALRRLAFSSNSSKFSAANSSQKSGVGGGRTLRVRPSIVLMPTLGYIEKSDRHRRGQNVHFTHGGSFSCSKSYYESYIHSALGDCTILHDGVVDDENEEEEEEEEDKESVGEELPYKDTIRAAYGDGFRRLPPVTKWPTIDFDMECDEGEIRYTSIDELRHCFVMSGVGPNWYSSPALVSKELRDRSSREATRIFKRDSEERMANHDEKSEKSNGGNKPLLVTETEDLWGNQAVFRAYVYRKIAVVITFELYSEYQK